MVAPCVGACLVPLVVNLMFTLCLQTCPDISTNDFKALVNTLLEFCHTRTMTAEDVFQKVLILQ